MAGYACGNYSPAEIKSALKEDRFIILPVPIGSPVYGVMDKCGADFHSCPFEGGYGGLSWRCSPDGSKCKAFYYEKKFSLSDLSHIGITVYLHRSEAAAAVEKLNQHGGKP